ncbi:DUF7669 domain-containing protein [Lentzea albidocapillata]|uniref:DUF7669 domain-containing protein n=1 Tax=Lentzea albidocapillata TaxID=40571 RepID=UPI0015A4A8C9|nr:hypothetical protein [Lentzea albidocapillata]
MKNSQNGCEAMPTTSGPESSSTNRSRFSYEWANAAIAAAFVGEDRSVADTIWDRLEECVQDLSEPFRASEMVGWFRRHYPDVKEQSLRAHIQIATSNASPASRGMFVNRRPLITRIEHGLYRRFDGDPGPMQPNQITTRDTAMTQRALDVDIEAAVGRYLHDRDRSARYTSFDYCFNHFQQHRTGVAAWGEPTGMEVSCLQLGFYLASWGMLRGSSGLLQRSARHLVPLIETLADAPAEVWDLDLDGYDREGIDLVLRTALDVRRALRPVEASDTLVTKVMLGVFGCVPAFDTYFMKGFGVSTFSKGSLRRVGEFYRATASIIDRQRQPTLDFTTGQPTTRLYTRAKVVDMIFFIEGGYPRQ